MIHHERLRPPSHDYPADEWNVIEKGFHPEFLAQLETMLALGNGYLGMRGCPEEGGPNAENTTLINGFYETRPIVYPEDAYGFAKVGQTIIGVTDSKIIKLFVDDEPFWLPNANLLSYDRRLNMKSGTLDREILWGMPTGKQVLITSRRLVSFANRHVAAISYQVTLLNAAASLVISSEMAANEPRNDPLTTGDSSLSSCVEAIIAAEVGDVDKAIRYGMAALLMDLADVGGNVKDGCHIASMGGTWMMLAYGLGGMRDDDGALSFWPRRAPEDNAMLRFPVTYRGQMLEVEIGQEKVEYALRGGECLLIRHETEEIQLTPEQPVAVRPVSRW